MRLEFSFFSNSIIRIVEWKHTEVKDCMFLCDIEACWPSIDDILGFWSEYLRICSLSVRGLSLDLLMIGVRISDKRRCFRQHEAWVFFFFEFNYKNCRMKTYRSERLHDPMRYRGLLTKFWRHSLSPFRFIYNVPTKIRRLMLANDQTTATVCRWQTNRDSLLFSFYWRDPVFRMTIHSAVNDSIL
jgi:hypothetical protein